MLEANDYFGVFEFRPLEPGYGVTIEMLYAEYFYLLLKDLQSHLLK